MQPFALPFVKISFSKILSVSCTSSTRTYATLRRAGSKGLQNVSRRKPRVDNSLLSPVYIPEDPSGVLKSSHPAANLLSNSGLVVQRNLELGNLLLGFEQANKYVIMDPNGKHVGFIAEEELGISKIIARQWFRTHRAFTAHVFDKDEKEVLRLYRPFSFVNSRIRVFDPIDPTSTPTTDTKLSELRMIGECHQQWHLFRRKYNLFLHHDPITTSFASQAGEQLNGNTEGHGMFTQFAYIDEPFLSWDFSLLAADDKLIGSVNRNFAGFGREIFTDTGVYALRMDSAPAYQTNGKTTVVENEGGRGMTLDERAVMLAAAVTIDFDYFSRHSGHGGGFAYFPFFGSDYVDVYGETRPIKASTKVDENSPSGGNSWGSGLKEKKEDEDSPSGGNSWGSEKNEDEAWPWDD